MRHVHRAIRSSEPRKPAGFTLVEILLALALTIALMGAVYTAIELYRQLSTTGRQQIERAQIVRAIHRRFAVDIRSVVFTPPDDSQSAQGQGQAADSGSGATSGSSSSGSTSGSSTQAGSSGSSSSNTTTAVEVIDPSTAVTGTAKGVVGDADSLVLHISKPPVGMAYTSAQGGGALSVTGCNSDLMSVTYLYASPNGATALSKAVAAYTGKSGLARLQGDRLAMNTADLSGNVDELAKTAIILAEEVVGVQFEYLDGTAGGTPQVAWDSTVQKKLPRAIRITLELKPKATGDASAAGGNYTQTFTIAVPAADAKPPELDDELGLGF
jgi:hypothetical protein